MTYDPKKAALYNKLIKEGASEDAAIAQAGITANDFGSYAIGSNGELGSLIVGTGVRPGIEVVTDRNTPARVNYAQTASGLPAQQPTQKNVSWTTTSTETVSGGGSTTITSGLPQPTAQSRAVQPAINAKQAEIDQFIKDNPSNFARKRQGLPPLTPEQAAQRQAQLNTLEDQRSQLTNQQQALTTPGTPTVTTVPNTTTTTTTVTSGRSSSNQPVDFFADEQLNQQTELVIDRTLPTPATPASPRPSSATVPQDDPSAGEAEAREFLAQQQRVEQTQAQPGISPFGEEDDVFVPPTRTPQPITFDEFGAEIPAGADAFAFDEASVFPEPPPTENPGAQTTFDEFGNITYPVADDGAAFSELPDDDLAFREGVDPGPGYETVDPFAFDEPPTENPGAQTTFDEFGNVVYPTADDNLAFEPVSDDNLAFQPEPVDPTAAGLQAEQDLEAQFEADRQTTLANQEAAATKAALANAQAQSAIQQRQNENTKGDWRVRIRLLPGADYLYKAGDPGILKPLVPSDGVIFPYVPQIQTSYQAKYDAYDLVHSNYRGYFYRGSSVNEVQITGTFTAQDTQEAEYVLAVIHFFRSVTKMFYGKDALRGAPPPLVELSGMGQYQFNNHPCVVSNFNYNLPNNVNYIRTTPNNQGLNLTPRRNLSGTPSAATYESVKNRLSNAGLPRGATPERLSLGDVEGVVSGTEVSTYVPTKLEIQITLLPIQTRQQVSQQFSLENFAKGNLIKGGFW